MPKLALFYGSSTGNTERIAKILYEKLKDHVDCFKNIADVEPKEWDNFDAFILGVPTWHIGELQDDWEGYFYELDEIDLQDKACAFFGLGDCIGYPDTYQDALGILHDKCIARGAKIFGRCSTEGYDYQTSRAEIDGKLCGLCLDEDAEPEKTEARIDAWVAQLKAAIVSLKG